MDRPEEHGSDQRKGLRLVPVCNAENWSGGPGRGPQGPYVSVGVIDAGDRTLLVGRCRSGRCRCVSARCARRSLGEFVLAPGRAEERWRRKRGLGVAGWVCGVMLTNTLLPSMSPVSLTLGLVVMAAAPRSPFSAPRALVLQQAPRAFSTSNLDLVLSQADSAMKTVSKAQDLMMAGCFPCPVFWCTYAHLPWLLQQLDLAWPTLNRRDVPRATPHYEPGCACPPCLSLWCVLTTSVTNLGPSLCAPTLLRPRPRLLSPLQYSFVVRPRRRGA